MKVYLTHHYKDFDGFVRRGSEYLADKDFQVLEMATVQRKLKTVKWPADIHSVTIRMAPDGNEYRKKAAATITVPRINLSKQEWD